MELKHFKLVLVCLFLFTICFVAPSSAIFGNGNAKKDVLLFPGDFQNLVEDKDGNILSYGIQYDDEIDKLFQLQFSKKDSDIFKSLIFKNYYFIDWDGNRFFFTSKDFKDIGYYSVQQKKIIWRKTWSGFLNFMDSFNFTKDTKGGLTLYQNLGRNGTSLTHFTPTGEINFSGSFEIRDLTNEKYLPTSYVANFSFDNAVIADQQGNCYIIGNVFRFSNTKQMYKNPFVCKISPKGVPLWCRMLFDPVLQKQEIESSVVSVYLDNNKLLLIGCNEPSIYDVRPDPVYPKTCWFASVDTDGQFLWKSEYEFTKNYFPNEIVKDKENNYWITGQFYQRNGSLGGIYGSYPALIELSHDGKINLAKIYGKLPSKEEWKDMNEELAHENYGSFNQISINKENNKYIIASIFDFSFMCKLKPDGMSSVIPSHSMNAYLKRSWNETNPDWVSAKFIWDPVDFKFVSDSKPITNPDFMEESFQSYYLAKDDNENLVIRTDEMDIPLVSLQRILIEEKKDNTTGYSYADIQDGIQVYIKQESIHRKKFEILKQKFLKAEWKFQIKLLVVYTSLILLLSCLFFWINRNFGRKQQDA